MTTKAPAKWPGAIHEGNGAAALFVDEWAQGGA